MKVVNNLDSSKLSKSRSAPYHPEAYPTPKAVCIISYFIYIHSLYLRSHASLEITVSQVPYPFLQSPKTDRFVSNLITLSVLLCIFVSLRTYISPLLVSYFFHYAS